LVGRDADFRLLEFVLGRAAAGTGSVVLISGEAGSGARPPPTWNPRGDDRDLQKSARSQ
jgi:hypothetical protein